MIYVVAAYLIVNKKFLVAQRAYGSMKGHWEFPGGKIEKGETLFNAIVREILEELRIDIIPEKVVRSFSHTYPFDTVNLTLITCHMKDKNQQIVSDGSHSDVAWIDASETNKTFAPLDEQILAFLKKHQV